VTVEFELDGQPVRVARDNLSLLDALREELGVHSVKDGCSPQGQCGCCTVLVDGQARVSCVTPVRRLGGRSVTTVDGLADAEGLARAFLRHGASQCGFCTPGILCRLAALGPQPSRSQVETALLAHLCRCTGWLGIVEAALDTAGAPAAAFDTAGAPAAAFDTTGAPAAALDTTGAPAAADPAPAPSERAALEGHVLQGSGLEVVLGRGGFADDTSPEGCLVAVPDGQGGWALGETLTEARAAAGKVQGRRSGRDLTYPLEVPPGEWDLTLQTTWVEPAYLEPDCSWCAPGEEPADPRANGGDFGAKELSVAPFAARELARIHGRPVRVLLSREDVVRLGPKRPPLAAGMRLDGAGVIRVASAAGVAARISAAAPFVAVEEVDVAGPARSASIRAAGWAEVAVLLAACTSLREGTRSATVSTPEGATATAEVDVDHDGWPRAVRLHVACGDSLDEVVLRSYLTGATHMALGWVCSEAIALDDNGLPEDLTIRSFGVIRAKDMPPIEISLDRDAPGRAVNGSDAAFAAVAAAVWLAQGHPPRWPTRRGGRT
jgi:aerobic-type carbon monoxide dehydrogenase small subunit (CoxS/CutS family)